MERFLFNAFILGDNHSFFYSSNNVSYWFSMLLIIQSCVCEMGCHRNQLNMSLEHCQASPCSPCSPEWFC